MTRAEYQTICKRAQNGRTETILNLDNHTQGEVISCRLDFFNVRVGQGWEVWKREFCEPSIRLSGETRAESDGGDFQI